MPGSTQTADVLGTRKKLGGYGRGQAYCDWTTFGAVSGATGVRFGSSGITYKNKAFFERALESGVAYGENGLAKAVTGVALGDYDNNGDEDLLVLNLMREGATLFSNSGRGDFVDVSAKTQIHNLTYLFTGFGAGWLDIDHHGRLDLFLANGAVTRREDNRGFKERNLLLRQAAGRFEEIPTAALAKPAVHRAAAFGGLDNDGDVDIVLNVNNGQALLLNNTAPSNNWLTVLATPGSRVELKAAGLPPKSAMPGRTPVTSPPTIPASTLPPNPESNR